MPMSDPSIPTAGQALPSDAATPASRLLENAAAIPVMPEVGAQLIRWMRRDDVSQTQMAELVERDQSLTAKVLRMANSAQFGRRQVATLRDAMSVIGQRRLRDLVLSACFVSSFPPAQGFDRERFWCRSLATAGYAHALAQTGDADSGTAYLAGMLLHVGQLLMLMASPEQVASCLRDAAEVDEVPERERAAFGCTHFEVSALLASRWGFPDILADRIAWAAYWGREREPASSTEARDGVRLRIASVLADAGDLGLDPWDALMTRRAFLLAHVGWSAEDEERIASSLPSYSDLTIGAEQLLS